MFAHFVSFGIGNVFGIQPNRLNTGNKTVVCKFKHDDTEISTKLKGRQETIICFVCKCNCEYYSAVQELKLDSTPMNGRRCSMYRFPYRHLFNNLGDGAATLQSNPSVYILTFVFPITFLFWIYSQNFVYLSKRPFIQIINIYKLLLNLYILHAFYVLCTCTVNIWQFKMKFP